MSATIFAADFSLDRTLGRRLTAGLAVSIVLHGAMLVAMRPTPGSPGGGERVRITARVQSPSAPRATSEPRVQREKMPAPAPRPAAAPPQPVPAPTPPREAAPAISTPAPTPAEAVGSGGAYYFRASEVDEPARAALDVEPSFAKGTEFIEGFIVAEVFVSERGTVDDVVLLISDPPDVFDAAIIAALKATRYTPAVKNGIAVKTAAVFYTKIEPVIPTLAVPLTPGMPRLLSTPGVLTLPPRTLE